MMNKMFDYLREKTNWEIETFENETNITYYTTNGGEETITLFKDVRTPKAFLNQVRDYYNGFIIDDFVSMWLEAKGNGIPGVPGAVELVKEAQEIDEMIADLVAHTERFIEQNKLKVGDIATIRNDDPKLNNQRVKVKEILNNSHIIAEIGEKEQITVLEEDLEKLDQTNKYTVLFYSGSGAYLTPIEVTAEDEEDAIKIATEKVFRETNKGGQYIDSLNEVLALENDPYYKEDFEKYKLKHKDLEMDFLQFLEEYYNYIYVDTPNYGALYIKHGEHLKIRKGWGVVVGAFKEDEKLFG